MDDLAARLRHYLGVARITQADLARAIGVKPAAVSQWLSQQRDRRSDPTHENLAKAVAALGIDLATFWGPLPEEEKQVEEGAA